MSNRRKVIRTTPPSMEEESATEQEVNTDVISRSSGAPAEQSPGASGFSSGASVHSLDRQVDEATHNLDKLDLKNVSSSLEKSAGDADCLPITRKSITIISSGSGSEEDDCPRGLDQVTTKKVPTLPTKPLLDQKPIKLPKLKLKLSSKIADVKTKAGNRVEPKAKPKAKLTIANVADEPEKIPTKKKTIKKILTFHQLEEKTRQAEKAEKNRRARIFKRLRLFKKTFPNEDPESSRILDFDQESKQVIVQIIPKFLSFMKPHQLEGVKFMYDCVIENVQVLETDKVGSGCILAHSMGLGKTFQIFVFLHTILTNQYIEDNIQRVLIIVPYNVIENWTEEFDKWFKQCKLRWNVNTYEIHKEKTMEMRVKLLERWHNRGGIMLITHTLFSQTIIKKMDKAAQKDSEVIRKCLLTPGPDLVIVDEGHLLKNDESNINEALTLIETNRRIVLTGTPLQNNLTEYFVMVDFCKPLLLGTKKEFRNRFQNPIESGQNSDSTGSEVMVMKKRIHVLIEMLKGCLHRCDYNILVPYLQPKCEFVLVLTMTQLQITLYQYYLDTFADGSKETFFRDKYILSLILTHPALVHDYYLESKEKDSNNFAVKIGPWYEEFVDLGDIYQMEHSAKFTLLFAILEECQRIGDKLVIFSQSLLNLNLIERFLRHKMEASRMKTGEEGGGVSHLWTRNKDYFRIDGGVESSERSSMIASFNDPDEQRARLMLLSTRAGGIGINLVGANRAIIFDASFNPSNDLQAIFRIYRFGQTKPVFVYRFTAFGTMEEKIYKRQIVKQSLSCRVVDEQQILRHYTSDELRAMYLLHTEYNKKRVLPLCHKDKLLNDFFLDYDSLIVSWHEHDTLLENKPEEELSEEERKAAWLEYEKARNMGPPEGAANESFNQHYKAPGATDI